MKKALLQSLGGFLILLSLNVHAQYWRLVGNADATSASKIGTTNAVPIGFYTSNLQRVSITAAGSVGIGNTAPAASALLDISSVKKGVLLPRMTLTQRNAIASPAAGLLIYQTTNTPGFYYYNGGWKSIAQSGGANTTLSNLSSPTAINQTLNFNVPAGSTAINITNGRVLINNNSGIGLQATGSDYGVVGSGSLGVYGSGNSYGVYGAASNYGVYGSGGTYGVYGYSSNYGVYGSSSNYGVYGKGFYAFYGSSPSGYGAILVSGGHGIDASTSSTAGNIYGGVFHHNVYVYGTVTQTSDGRMKKNITQVKDAMTIIGKLKPSYYEFKHEGDYASLNLPQGKHYGLIAQELEEVLPELVSPAPLGEGGDTSTYSLEKREASSPLKGGKGINYTELIPILIKGMQELNDKNKEIDELREEIISLRQMVQDIRNGGTGAATTAFLGQNAPNPVKGSTTISYGIPEATREARILVTDAKGRQLKIYNVNGNGTILFSAGTLPSGTYNYSLVTDGKTITTKKMIIAR